MACDVTCSSIGVSGMWHRGVRHVAIMACGMSGVNGIMWHNGINVMAIMTSTRNDVMAMWHVNVAWQRNGMCMLACMHQAARNGMWQCGVWHVTS
jgi:hypothetical protein